MKKLFVLTTVVVLGSASYGVSAHHCDDDSCDPADLKPNKAQSDNAAEWVYEATGDGNAPFTYPPVRGTGYETGLDSETNSGDGDCYTDEYLAQNPEPSCAYDGILMTMTKNGKTVEACKDLVDDQYDITGPISESCEAPE